MIGHFGQRRSLVMLTILAAPLVYLQAAATSSDRHHHYSLYPVIAALEMENEQPEAQLNHANVRADWIQLLLGPQVVSKIRLGIYADVSGTLYTTRQPVDTEIYPTKIVTVSYRCQRSYILESEIALLLQPGTRLNVGKVNFKNDRIEINVQGQSGEHAKLWLMLGKNFQESTSLEQVAALLSQVAYSPSLDKITNFLDLKAHYISLKEGVDMPSRASQDRLEDARQLYALAEKIASIQPDVQRLLPDVNTKIYDLNAIKKDIELLSTMAAVEKVRSLTNQVAELNDAVKRLREEVDGFAQPTQTAEANRQLDILSRLYDAVIGRQRVVEQLGALTGQKQAPTPASDDALLAQISASRGAVERNRDRLALIDKQEEEQAEKLKAEQEEKTDLAKKVQDACASIALLQEAAYQTTIPAYLEQATHQEKSIIHLLKQNRTLTGPEFWGALDSRMSNQAKWLPLKEGIHLMSIYNDIKKMAQ